MLLTELAALSLSLSLCRGRQVEAETAKFRSQEPERKSENEDQHRIQLPVQSSKVGQGFEIRPLFSVGEQKAATKGRQSRRPFFRWIYSHDVSRSVT